MKRGWARRGPRVATASVLALVLSLTPFVLEESSRAQVAPPAQQPNVLVIVTDDQRDFGTLKVMPELRERIYGQGVGYSNAFATTPQCCPSRASIMTGQYAHNHGVGNNKEAEDLDHATTVQRHLSDAGYRTGLVGKFLNDWPLTEAPPYFEDYSLFSYGYYGTRWNLNGEITYVDEYSTTFIAERVERFITEGEELNDLRPWYLYVTPWAPHENAIPEPQYRRAPVGRFRKNAAMKESDCRDKPRWVDCREDFRGIAQSRRKMLRTLMSVDDLVARTDDALEAADEARDTLVVFVSDNGYLWGEHGLEGKKPPYRGGIEIPMAVRWPGHTTPGAIDSRLTGNIDIAPTIYEATGVEPLVTVDGRSLLDPGWTRNRLLLELKRHKGWPTWASLISGGYHYTEYYRRSGSTSFREYYRLKKDPWELVNTIEDRKRNNDPKRRRLRALSQTLAEDRSCAGDACP